jgi:phage baseplate assembly protein W
MADINTTEVALKLPLSLDLAGNLVLANTQEQIWADRVRIALGTRIGERVMRPTYGTQIGESLFDTVSATTDIVKKEVGRVFHEQFPLLEVTNTDVTFNEFTNELTINIIYLLPNKQESTTQVGVVTISDTNAPFEELL